MRVSFPAPNIALRIHGNSIEQENRTFGSFFRCGKKHRSPAVSNSWIRSGRLARRERFVAGAIRLAKIASGLGSDRAFAQALSEMSIGCVRITGIDFMPVN